jgi:hypothetical protein
MAKIKKKILIKDVSEVIEKALSLHSKQAIAGIRKVVKSASKDIVKKFNKEAKKFEKKRSPGRPKGSINKRSRKKAV